MASYLCFSASIRSPVLGIRTVFHLPENRADVLSRFKGDRVSFPDLRCLALRLRRRPVVADRCAHHRSVAVLKTVEARIEHLSAGDHWYEFGPLRGGQRDGPGDEDDVMAAARGFGGDGVAQPSARCVGDESHVVEVLARGPCGYQHSHGLEPV